ncbi:hypothetical protein BgiMline_020668 [Biomphalaria glabrata]
MFFSPENFTNEYEVFDETEDHFYEVEIQDNERTISDISLDVSCVSYISGGVSYLSADQESSYGSVDLEDETLNISISADDSNCGSNASVIFFSGTDSSDADLDLSELRSFIFASDTELLDVDPDFSEQSYMLSSDTELLDFDQDASEQSYMFSSDTELLDVDQDASEQSYMLSSDSESLDVDQDFFEFNSMELVSLHMAASVDSSQEETFLADTSDEDFLTEEMLPEEFEGMERHTEDNDTSFLTEVEDPFEMFDFSPAVLVEREFRPEILQLDSHHTDSYLRDWLDNSMAAN